ncbi:MAG: hypothetical protein J2P54_22855 [Bradyrhizobiaceae bacterium]|nr:hypothetical protein [Bradyrhizobiaceae bacterium]
MKFWLYEIWLYGLGATAFVVLPAYITSEIVRIRPGLEGLIGCAIFLGLIWIEIKVGNLLYDRWRFRRS